MAIPIEIQAAYALAIATYIIGRAVPISIDRQKQRPQLRYIKDSWVLEGIFIGVSVNILAWMYLIIYRDIMQSFELGLSVGLAKLGMLIVALGVGFPIAVWFVTGDMGEYIDHGRETNHD